MGIKRGIGSRDHLFGMYRCKPAKRMYLSERRPEFLRGDRFTITGGGKEYLTKRHSPGTPHGRDRGVTGHAAVDREVTERVFLCFKDTCTERFGCGNRRDRVRLIHNNGHPAGKGALCPAL